MILLRNLGFLSPLKYLSKQYLGLTSALPKPDKELNSCLHLPFPCLPLVIKLNFIIFSGAHFYNLLHLSELRSKLMGT